MTRSTHGWRVHSAGTFDGAGRDYMITVLTQGNSTMSHGVATIQNIARAIHKDLVPTTASTVRHTPTTAPEEAFVAVPSNG
jgi:hypothetical protein